MLMDELDHSDLELSACEDSDDDPNWEPESESGSENESAGKAEEETPETPAKLKKTKPTNVPRPALWKKLAE